MTFFSSRNRSRKILFSFIHCENICKDGSYLRGGSLLRPRTQCRNIFSRAKSGLESGFCICQDSKRTSVQVINRLICNDNISYFSGPGFSKRWTNPRFTSRSKNLIFSELWMLCSPFQCRLRQNIGGMNGWSGLTAKNRKILKLYAARNYEGQRTYQWVRWVKLQNLRWFAA